MNTTLMQKIKKTNILPTRFIEPLLARPLAGTDAGGEKEMTLSSKKNYSYVLNRLSNKRKVLEILIGPPIPINRKTVT